MLVELFLTCLIVNMDPPLHVHCFYQQLVCGGLLGDHLCTLLKEENTVFECCTL